MVFKSLEQILGPQVGLVKVPDTESPKAAIDSGVPFCIVIIEFTGGANIVAEVHARF
jgi:hypothetical protein